MYKNIKKELFLLIIMLIILILFIMSRCEVHENAVYVKLLSEDTYFDFKEHIAPKEIINEFKRIKGNSLIPSFIHCIAESSDCLLYEDESNIFHIIKIENGQLQDSLYKPKFEYTIDGTYIYFVFEDEFLNYVDRILMCLKLNGQKAGFYPIPISTIILKCEAIIQIEKLSGSTLENIDFEIAYTHYYGENWTLPFKDLYKKE